MRINTLGWGVLLTTIALSVLIILNTSLLKIGMESLGTPLYGQIRQAGATKFEQNY
jgi:hypothetical protein